MAPCTRSQTKRVVPTPSSPPQSNARTQPKAKAKTQPKDKAKTQPKAKANTQPKAKEETQPKAEDEPQPKSQDETQPEKSSAGQVPETQPKGSNAGQVSEQQPEEKVPSIPEDSPKVQPLRDHGLSMLRESNAMTPIGHLPVELLSAIFIEVATAEYEADKTTRTRIHLSLVSHRWRTVALSTPALWRRLVLRNYRDVPVLHECIVRSKKLQLDLDLLAPPWHEEEDEKLRREPHRWSKKHAEVLLDQASRARSLHVDASPGTCRALNWPKVSKSLKHFRLNDTNYIDQMPVMHRHQSLDGRRYERLDLLDLLHTTFPNLQSLEITDHGISLGDLWLPASLVTLRIVNIQAFRRNENASDILDVLRDLPVLEHLSLTNATTKLDANALEHSKPVSLPRLKSFSSEGPLSTCLAFIKSLKLPDSARRSLTVYNKGGADEDLARLGNELIVELAKWETNFRSVLANNSWGLKWMAWKQIQPVEDLESLAPSVVQDVSDLVADNDDCSTSSADLEIHFKETDQTLQYELLFAHVKTLVLFLHPSWGLHVPSFFPNLDDLEVMSCVFKACQKDDKKQRFFVNLNESNAPLPQLRVLRLRQFPLIQANYDPLLAMCQKRPNAKRLDIQLTSCYEVSKTELKKLRAVSNSVAWDGQKPRYSSWY